MTFQMNKVEKFIKKFKFIYSKELEYVFTRGNCYFFAVILREHFGGEIYYLPIENHFVCCIGKNFYDITGKIKLMEHPYKWTDYKDFDELDYKRVVRDCLNFETRKD